MGSEVVQVACGRCVTCYHFVVFENIAVDVTSLVLNKRRLLFLSVTNSVVSVGKATHGRCFSF